MFDRGSPPNLTVVMRLPGGWDDAVVLGQAPIFSWIPIGASLNGGMLEVTVGDTRFRRRLRIRSGVVPALMCSSGDFEFELEEGVVLSSERFEQ
jgi:hypothetical protein